MICTYSNRIPYTCHLHWHYTHNLRFCCYKVLLTWSWIGVKWLGIREHKMMIVLMSYVILCLGNSCLVILCKVFLVTRCGMWSPKLSTLVLGRISARGKLWTGSVISKGSIAEQGEFVGMQGPGMGIQLVLLTQGMIHLSKRRAYVAEAL